MGINVFFMFVYQTMSYLLVTTTTEHQSKAQEIAKQLIIQKIAACVQIDSIQSIYTRENKIQNSTEYKLSIKTKESLYDKVENTIKTLHNYNIPEIIAIPITHLSQDYAQRIDENTLQ